jgi:Mg-chelatase subunit ChlD
VQFSRDGFATATHVVRERDPGVFVYKVGVRSPGDADPDDDVVSTSGAVVTVSGEPRILHVAEQPGRLSGAPSASFDVRSVAPSQLPASAAALLPYGAVILDDVPPERLNSAQLDALAQHVESSGAGLLYLGSTRSLHGGVSHDAGLGKLLPIDLRPRSGVRTAGVALVIVVDKSGSMDEHIGGASKIEFARQGMRSALERMAPTDAFGVIAFDSTPTPVAPLQSGHDEPVIIERLNAIRPGGSTAMAPAVQVARDWLMAADPQQFPRRHVLLVSDGRSSAADARQLEALVRAGGFQFSVIALGRDSDRRLLGTLAEASGGRAYFPEDVRELPLLTARETARVAGGRTVEEVFLPRLWSHPISTGLELDRMAALTGYVVSAPKTGAEIVMGSHRDDPILAAWRYGLGRVAVYTADLHSAWSARLRGSPTYAPLLARTIQWLSHEAADGPFYVRFHEDGSRLRVVVDIVEGGTHVTGLNGTASVRGPSGDIAAVEFAESVPGRYEGSFAAIEAGPYVVSLEAQRADGSFNARTLRGFYVNADREHRRRGVDTTLLSALSGMTGGRRLDQEADPFGQRPVAYHPLRGWLLGAAFFTFLSELLAPWLQSLVRRSWRRADDALPQAAAP